MPTPRIFLSYARGDDEDFVRRLHADLTHAGFDVWFDRVNMPSRSLTFHQEIADAIRDRDRMVLVVGPGTALSEYVTQEWRFAWEMEKTIVPIMRLGDYSTLPDGLKIMNWHIEDFRDGGKDPYEFHLLQLIRILNEPAPPLGKLIAVPSLPRHFLAQEDRLRALKDAVLTDLQKPVVITGAATRVGLHGMGGIGKSVLASVLAHDRQVRQSYPDGVVWIPFGQQPNLVQMQRNAAKVLGGDDAFQTEYEGKAKLRELLLNKAVLLICDDVWEAKHTAPFDVLGPRCRALITTRDAGLLAELKAQEFCVQLLTDEEALSLLVKTSGTELAALTPETRELIRAVARECDHLPLALALCGGMAFGPNGIGWSAILDALHSADLEDIATDHPLAEQHASLWKAIALSVQQLTPDDQKRWAELSLFPEDETVPEAAVRTLWTQTGALKSIAAERLLKRLADRSLIYLDTKKGSTPANPLRRISLHDLLHDYAKRLAGDKVALHRQMLLAYARQCPEGWASGPNDGWFLQHLRDHILAYGCAEEFVKLLFDLRWLEKKNEAGLTFELTEDFTAALNSLQLDHPERKRLRLLEEALRRDIHFIARHAKDYPQALFQCLWNSAWWYDCPDATPHYVEPLGGWKTPPPWQSSAPNSRLSTLLERWRVDREASHEGFYWFRTLRPPFVHLGAGQISVLRGHKYIVTSVAYSPDGRRVLSGAADGTLRVWDADSGRELAVLCGHKELVMSVAYSPDGRRALSGSDDKTVRVWDAESGRELAVLRGHEGGVRSVAYSPDGRRVLSGSEDNTVRIWDAESGRELAVMRGHEEGVISVAYSPDGHRVLSGSFDQTVRVWDVEIGRELAVLRGHEGGVMRVAYSPDGRRVLSFGSGDETLRVWDADSGRELAVLRGHESGVSSVAYSPDSRRVLCGSYDGTVCVWDAESGRELAVPRGHDGVITSVAYSPDSRRVLSGSADMTLRVWDAESGRQLAVLRGHEDMVTRVAFSPDGRRVLSGSADKTLRVWDVESGREVAVLRGHEDEVTSVAYSPDGRRVLSGSEDKTVRLWDAENGREVAVLCGHEYGITSVEYASDGQIIKSQDFTRKELIWDAENGRCLDYSPNDIQTLDELRFRSAHWFDRDENDEMRLQCFPRFATVAWFSDALHNVESTRDGRNWAGSVGSHLVLLRLEPGSAKAL